MVAYGALGALSANSAFFTVVFGPDAQPTINPSIHPTNTVLFNIILLTNFTRVHLHQWTDPSIYETALPNIQQPYQQPLAF
jgi:uncharacterized Zn-finger protein